MTQAEQAVEECKEKYFTAHDVEALGGKWSSPDLCYIFEDGSRGAFSKKATYKKGSVTSDFSHYAFEIE